MTERADYGLDAPGVVRNLGLIGGAGLLLAGTTAMGWWSGIINLSPVASVRLLLPLGRMGVWFGSSFTATMLWMVWSSKVGKLRERERLLDRITWTGRERVLDVGCGRGLMLIGAAKRLTSGKATGIDIWQTEDLSGNRPDATLENARREGVADRIEIKTADMRSMPFDANSFDVVVSMAAIHNLYKADDRAAAIKDIARVLKPGGRAVIDDIRHGSEYAVAFETHGCRVRARESGISSWLWTALTMGSLRPALLVVEKLGAAL